MALHIRHLHAVHGQFVRLSPNLVTIASPTGLKQLWGNKDFEKGDFYDAFAQGISKNRDLFTIRQNSFHSQRKKIHAGAWSMTSVLEMEKYVDDVIQRFMQKMSKLADRDESVDLGLWTWRFTYDIIGELFFGKSYGFLEQESDVGNLMAAGDTVTPFMGMMGMAPAWMRPLLMSMLAVPSIASALKNIGKVKATGKKQVAERLSEVEDGKETRGDILGKLVQIVQNKGQKVDWTTQDVEQECFTAT